MTYQTKMTSIVASKVLEVGAPFKNKDTELHDRIPLIIEGGAVKTFLVDIGEGKTETRTNPIPVWIHGSAKVGDYFVGTAVPRDVDPDSPGAEYYVCDDAQIVPGGVFEALCEEAK